MKRKALFFIGVVAFILGAWSFSESGEQFAPDHEHVQYFAQV
ncbi:hypothetical protein [Niallia taxi]|nr:hypothetical protein [Niallia taxi]